MRWTVVWSSAALDELAEIWLSAPSREAITIVADALDHSLRSNPETAGESRPDGLRIVVSHPLAAIFQVTSEDRMVEVLQIWRIA